MTNRSLNIAPFLTIACAGLLSTPALAGGNPIGASQPSALQVEYLDSADPNLPPVVTEVTPAMGPAGTKVEIKGVHLFDVTRVIFFPNRDGFVREVTNEKILVTVPNGAKSGPVKLVTDAGAFIPDFTFNIPTLQ
jgi:hypothetical protein